MQFPLIIIELAELPVYGLRFPFTDLAFCLNSKIQKRLSVFMEILVNRIWCLSIGVVLDLILGDPQGWPHPVRLMGRLINGTERVLRGGGEGKGRGDGGQIRLGAALVVIVLGTVAATAWVVLRAAYSIHRFAGMGVEILLTYQIFAAKCLRVESMKVYDCLKAGDLAGAKAAVSMIVGRDTDSLDEEGVAKAAIETVAENTSDGVIAPMVYTALGGPVLGLCTRR